MLETWSLCRCRLRARSGGISALRLGRRERRELLYAGKVGTGFDRKSAAEVRRQLEPLAVKRSPLTTPIKKPGTIWVEPKFEAEVAYGHITHDGLVRHPSFKRLIASGDDYAAHYAPDRRSIARLPGPAGTGRSRTTSGT